MSRREEILHTAAVLFAEHGFHGVSMADLGQAVGISGPALYKHFRGKHDVLAQSLVDISTELLETGRARAAASGSARERLDALIAWHLDFAVDHPAYIVVQEREWSTLEDAARAEVRALQLAYVDLWVDTLRELRDLPRPEARTVVQATFGLLNSTPHSARVAKGRPQELLAASARAALLDG